MVRFHLQTAFEVDMRLWADDPPDYSPGASPEHIRRREAQIARQPDMRVSKALERIADALDLATEHLGVLAAPLRAEQWKRAFDSFESTGVAYAFGEDDKGTRFIDRSRIEPHTAVVWFGNAAVGFPDEFGLLISTADTRRCASGYSEEAIRWAHATLLAKRWGGEYAAPR